MADLKNLSSKRFKTIRKELRFTQSEFAKILQIPSSTADIERGKTKIPGLSLAILMKLFNINPLWIFSQSEEKYISAAADISPKVITVNNSGTENILLVYQKAQAGYSANIQDARYYEQLPAFSLPLPEFRNATYRGFQVEGDSMEPNLHSNDWVIARAVSQIQEIINGQVYVVVLKDSVVVKKVHRTNENNIQLISFNEFYPPFSVSLQEVQELWQVISKITFGIEDSNSLLFKQLQQSMEDLKAQLKKINH